jgi:hypothetical protein
VRLTEIDLFGVYVAPTSLMMAAAWVVTITLRWSAADPVSRLVTRKWISSPCVVVSDPGAGVTLLAPGLGLITVLSETAQSGSRGGR